MNLAAVRINFESLSKGFAAFVRKKAADAGSTIVYLQGKDLIEENPADGSRRVSKEVLVQAQ